MHPNKIARILPCRYGRQISEVLLGPHMVSRDGLRENKILYAVQEMEDINDNFNRVKELGAIQEVNQKIKEAVDADNSELMPVKAICTAESYDLTKILPTARKWFAVSEVKVNSFLHLQSIDGHDIFVFKNGSFVTWGAQSDTKDGRTTLNNLIEQLLRILKPHEQGSLTSDLFEVEDMHWRENNNLTGSKSRIVSDSILEIGNASSCLGGGYMGNKWLKLALSNGLSDSVKLSVLEALLDKHVKKIKGIPIILEKGKRIPVGLAETLRLIGELLHFRAALNLDSEFLDVPEIYWHYPELEELYKSMTKSLETRHRISVLNKKIDYAESIAELLRTHLSESHMFRLEWAIVLLVGFEVLNSVLWWVF